MGTRWTTAAAMVLALLLSAPVAAADPADPVADPTAPETVVVDPVAAPAGPDEGVPHLPSPDNLPPGTTQEAPQHRTLGYLRDLWHAVRTEDVTMSDALLLFAQRPMNSTPPPGMSPRPPQSPPPPEPAPAVP